MAIRAVSHVAVGVRDMERALRFYRDALGLFVKLDTTEELPGVGGSEARKRRAAVRARVPWRSISAAPRSRLRSWTGPAA